MIVAPPKNEYQRQIYDIIKTREDFLVTRFGVNRDTKKKEEIPIWSEADKGIVYSLCTRDVPKFARIDWEYINLDWYVTVIKNTYEARKQNTLLAVISHCINNLNLGYQTKVDDKTIIRIQI